MGVDYHIIPAKKNPDGTIKLIFTDDFPHLSRAYYHYQPLFGDNLNIIEKIANKKLNLDFYEKADGSGYYGNENKDRTFDPKEVKSTIKIILEVIKENPTKFPHSYWIGFKGKTTMVESVNVFIGDNKVSIRGGWDECYYILNDKKVDLTKEKKEFLAYMVISEKINGKWVYKKGEKVTVIIKKWSFYDDFKHTLNDIIAICDYAIDHNHFVYSDLC